MRIGLIREKARRKIIYLLHFKLSNGFKTHGHLSENEGIALYKHAKKIDTNGNAVEVGSYVGKSTVFIAMGLRKRGGKLYCVDTFENQDMSEGLRETYWEFKENTKIFQDLLIVTKGFSNDIRVIQAVPDNLELVFIDASHDDESVRQDIANYLPKLKSGGKILFHDYGNTLGVKKPVDDSISNGDLIMNKIVDSMAICTKK
jgi:predicted O-methyltransferase YrrM